MYAPVPAKHTPLLLSRSPSNVSFQTFILVSCAPNPLPLTHMDHMHMQAVRQRMQYKTFIKWINHHLKKDKESKLRVEDLKTDFADGIKLIKLIELISEENLGKYNKKPISKFQKVENLNIPLAYINRFLKEQKISNQYSAENVCASATEKSRRTKGRTCRAVLRLSTCAPRALNAVAAA